MVLIKAIADDVEGLRKHLIEVRRLGDDINRNQLIICNLLILLIVNVFHFSYSYTRDTKKKQQTYRLYEQ